MGVVHNPNIGGHNTEHNLRRNLLETLLTMPKFHRYLVDHHIDALVVEHGDWIASVDVNSIPCPVFLISSAHEKDCYNFINSLSADMKLAITSFPHMDFTIRHLSAIGEEKSVVFKDNKGIGLLYMGSIQRNKDLKPYFLRPKGEFDKKLFAGVTRFFGHQWLVAEQDKKSTEMLIARFTNRQQLEQTIYKTLRDAESVYLAELDL